MTRILVCGGRAFNRRSMLTHDLDRKLLEHGDGLVIIVGYDKDDPRFQGADQIAYEWAIDQGVRVETYAAPWKIHGHGAGPIRNQRMLDQGRPDEGLGYPTPGEPNKGTNDMLRRLRKAGVKCDVRG